MKRIANDVAVTTICYTISGNQKIKIVDYESDYDCIHRKNGKTVFEGMLKDGFYDYNFTRFFDSKCRGLEVVDGTIVFTIFTPFEEYK